MLSNQTPPGNLTLSRLDADRPGSARRLPIPLVWYNLSHDLRPTAVAIVGVAFSAILMFMQLGFLGAVRTTATTILEKLDFDILLASPTYLYFYDTGSFPRIRLEQARSVTGVTGAVPLQLGFNTWSRQGGSLDQGKEARPLFRGAGRIRFAPRDLCARLRACRSTLSTREGPGDGPRACLRTRRGGGGADCRSVRGLEDLQILKRPDTILFDRDSHPDFGPIALLDPARVSVQDRPSPARSPEPGPARAVVGPREVEVVGSFHLPIGFWRRWSA